MKVYTKKEEGEAGPILCLIIGLIFSGVPFGFFIYLISIFINNRDKFFNTLLNGIILIFFALFFFVVGILILHYVFKKPVIKKAILAEKEKSEYNGKTIISMTFHLANEKENHDYECYTKEDNNFIEGNDYLISIKDAFSKIVKVLPFDNTYDTNSKMLNRDSKKGLDIVIFGIAFVIVGPVILIWIKSIFDIFNNNYNNELTFPLIVFTIFAILLLITIKKYKTGNTNKNTIDISKYPILKDEGIIINNAPRKVIIKEMLLTLIFWIFIELLFLVIYGIKGFNNFFLIIIICTFPLIFLEIFQLTKLCKYYNFDENLIKRYNINNTITINNIHSCKIIRLSNYLDLYCIIDENKNLLYKIINKEWSGTYYILDYNNKKIGEICRKLTSLNSTYIIRLINKNPILLEAKYEINYNYNVYNTNYNVIGNYSDNGGYNAMKSIICENDKNIAYIQFLSSNKHLYHFSSAEITVDENINTNEEIVFIAMGIILGNQVRFNMERKR